MCGIFALLNSNSSGLQKEFIYNEFMKGKKRGPEFSKLDETYIKMVLGFHRLAINGLNDESNQPLVINDIVLICNGEIYNYKELFALMNTTPTTDSDCEVIIHLYLKYGIAQTLTMLDGVFSFVLYDNRVSKNVSNKMYVARDPFGVRPLYYLKNVINSNKLCNMYGFASELKCLSQIYNINTYNYSISQFKPGTYSVFELANKVSPTWEPIEEFTAYFTPTFSYSVSLKNRDIFFCINNFSQNIATQIKNAVYKRCLTTERPIACLLSGGLDSSLITSLVNNYYNENQLATKLETYSIGLAGSEDLKYARIVANYLDTNHTEIIVTEDEMFEAIPEVIHAIESYDTTTIRASIGNYLLGKYISQHSDAKVIFNGDGADELLGGYLYMNKCPDDIEFDKETRRLLSDIHTFDVLRSDKSISSHGLEPRTPFLDRSFVNYVLSIPLQFRNHRNHSRYEKHLLRNGFTFDLFEDCRGRQILPDEILWRKKEAFSDGVSSHGRSLYQILQEKIAYKLNEECEGEGEADIVFEANIDTEKLYYKKIFDSHYPNCEDIIPYFWMPKYTNATDPSARTLDIYSADDMP